MHDILEITLKIIIAQHSILGFLILPNNRLVCLLDGCSVDWFDDQSVCSVGWSMNTNRCRKIFRVFDVDYLKTCLLRGQCMSQVAQVSKFKAGGGLGISLEGTVDLENGVETRRHHFICSVLPDGPVGINGLIKSKDELLEVRFGYLIT